MSISSGELISFSVKYFQ